MSKEKHRLLDTSVLMDDYKILLNLSGTLYVHSEVLDELDANRQDMRIDRESRYNAGQAIHVIHDTLQQQQNTGSREIPEGRGTLQVVFSGPHKKFRDADDALVDYLETHKDDGNQYVLLAEDTGLLTKAIARGHKAEFLREARKGASITDILQIPDCIDLDSNDRDTLRSRGRVTLGESSEFDDLINNQYLFLEGDGGMLMRYRKRGQRHQFSRLHLPDNVNSIRPRNKEQAYLLHACLDDDIKIMSALGQAGTGKTIIPLAVGIQKLREGQYKRIIIIRPVETAGKDLGYLPGSLEEKMGPFMEAIKDAYESISDGARRKPTDDGEVFEVDNMGLHYMVQKEILRFMTPTFARGRNLSHSYIIVDEAQNLDRKNTKLLATRVAQGSKIIFNGDPYQIDHPYMDRESNGLTYLTKRFLGQDIFSPVILTKSERSEVARLAAELL